MKKTSKPDRNKKRNLKFAPTGPNYDEKMLKTMAKYKQSLLEEEEEEEEDDDDEEEEEEEEEEEDNPLSSRVYKPPPMMPFYKPAPTPETQPPLGRAAAASKTPVPQQQPPQKTPKMKSEPKLRLSDKTTTANFNLFDVLVLLATAFIIFIVTLGVHTALRPHKVTSVTNTTIGGPLLVQSRVTAVDDASLNRAFELFTTLSLYGKPPLSDPVYAVVQLGNLGDTTTGWQALKVRVKQLGLLNFVGLDYMENSTMLKEGVCDICHAYFVGFLEIVEKRPDLVNLAEFQGVASEVLDVLYPLNVFWQVSTVQPWDIAGQLVLTKNNFLADANRTAERYARQFCNQYFAMDQPDYFNPVFWPFLAHGFELMVRRDSHILIPNEVQRLFGDMAHPPATVVKQIFFLGSAYEEYGDALGLLVTAFFSGVPTTNLTALDTVQALAAVQSFISISANGIRNVQLNASAVPVVVIARYTDDAGIYNAFKVLQSSVIFIFTDDDPFGVLTGGISIGSTILNDASSSRNMAVFDVTTPAALDGALGLDYRVSKQVSEFLLAIFGMKVTAGTNQTQTILSTFGIVDTLANGDTIDLGSRYSEQLFHQNLASLGLSLGVAHHSFAMQLESEFYEPVLGSTSSAPTGYTAPAFVDWTKRAPQCIPPVIDQGRCSNCWAIAPSDAMSIQNCVVNGVPLPDRLSHQHVTGCSNTLGGNGCDPQPISTAWSFFLGDIHTANCMPYIDTGTTDSGCPTKCANPASGTLDTVFGIVQGSYVKVSGAANIKHFLDTVGAITAAICVPLDLLDFFQLGVFNDGVYNPTSNPGCTGGHDTLLLGYYDNVPVPYWLIQNSWSKAFAANGIFKVAQNIPFFVGHTFWIETDTYGAVIRPLAQASVNPPTTVQVTTQNTSTTTTVRLRAKTYVSPYGCPRYVQNSHQDNHAATIQGCASSLGRMNNHSNIRHTNFVHHKHSAAVLPAALTQLLLIPLALALVFCGM